MTFLRNNCQNQQGIKIIISRNHPNLFSKLRPFSLCNFSPRKIFQSLIYAPVIQRPPMKVLKLSLLSPSVERVQAIWSICLALLAGSVCAACLAWLQRREPMQALGARVWWLVLPATLALLGGVSAWALPEAIQQYRY